MFRDCIARSSFLAKFMVNICLSVTRWFVVKYFTGFYNSKIIVFSCFLGRKTSAACRGMTMLWSFNIGAQVAIGSLRYGVVCVAESGGGGGRGGI